MGTQLTIEGRLVQGGVKMHVSKDMKTQQPKKDADGNEIKECFLAIAVPKMINGQANPQIGQYYGVFDSVARASFPHLFPNGGACTHPRFANKWQDGDGVDNNGKSVADNPGFAGHWVIKCNTRYLPTCYVKNSHGQLEQITGDPTQIIKRGYRVAVGLGIDGNGVAPDNNQAVPGLFVSPNLVLFVAPDTEIVSGPDPTEAFANVNAQPVGTTMPTAGTMPGAAVPGAMPTPGGPAMPGATPAATSGPPMPGATPTPSAGPPLPGATASPPLPPAAGPVFTMTASAQGATREAMHALGWTDDAMIANGHMVRVG